MHRTSKLKSFLIGLVCVLLNAYWVTAGNEIWGTVQLTIASLFFNAVFTLFVLSLLNLLLLKLSPRLALSRSEMLIIYVMVVMTSTLSGHTMMSFLMGGLTHGVWFESPENEWSELFLKYVPSWFTVSDRDVLQGYFEGESSLYLSQNLRAWWLPVLVWSGVVCVLWFVLMNTSVLLKQQWTQRERLSYPIVRVPLEMTTQPRRFFTNRLLWLGFAIAAGIDLLNGLNFLYPAVPHFPVRIHQIGHLFREKPWNAIGSWTHVSFYPFVIGLAYFMPIDLSFSCWFFYVFGKAQAVAASAVGLSGVYSFEQSIGAWSSIGFVALWFGRNHLSRVVRSVFSKQEQASDEDGSVSYRQAGLSVLAGMVLLTLFCLQAGMSLGIIAAFWALYFAIALGITRVRAELGPPVHTIIYVDPGRTLVAIFGTRGVGAANMTVISFLYAFNRCNRAHPMPSQLESLKLGSEGQVSNRTMLTAMVLATGVGILATFWIHLHLMYQYGASVHGVTYGGEVTRRLHSWFAYPQDTNPTALHAIGFGFGFTVFLMFMKARFLWWPLHPAGYVLTTGEGLVYSWFAIFISWALKLGILKHGGIRAYRAAVPFFIGLILGEYVVACGWGILGLILQIPTYRAWV